MPQFDALVPEWAKPDAASRVWRYMTLAKLISLLQYSSLYLSRMDHFSDPFEGSLPTAAIDERAEYFRVRGTDPAEAAKILEQVAQRLRASTYASCWNCNAHESEALWRLYCSDEGGVAICTTYQSLIDITGSDDRLFVGPIRYIDFESERFDWGDAYRSAMHKRVAFGHEHEIRLVKVLDGAADHAENPPGISIDVDVPSLIQRLYVSPYCPQWYHDVVASVVTKYAPTLASRISWSPMKALPRY